MHAYSGSKSPCFSVRTGSRSRELRSLQDQGSDRDYPSSKNQAYNLLAAISASGERSPRVR